MRKTCGLCLGGGLAAALVCSALNPAACCAQTNVIPVMNALRPATPYSVAVRGHYLYVGGGGTGLTILDISDPTNPVDTGYVDPLGPSTATTLSGDSVYRLGGAGYAGPLTILALQNPTNPIAVASIDGTFIQMKVSGTRLYLNGFTVSETGLFVYDISNPATPVRIAQLTDFNPSTQVLGEPIGGLGYPTAWLAYSTNADTLGAIASANSLAPSGNYLYTAGTSGLGVWDISNLTNSVAVGGIPNASIGLGIAVSAGYAYTVGNAGLSVYSLGHAASPPLSIAPTIDGLLCSWPTPNPAFVIQQNPDLNPAHWTTLTNGPVVIDSQNQVLLPKPETTMFYRLVSQ